MTTFPLLVLAAGLLRGEPVGGWPLFNWLILGYAVPGIYACLFARLFQNRGYPRLTRVAAIIALVLFFAFITLEVRHAFHGGELWHGHAGNRARRQVERTALSSHFSLLAFPLCLRGSSFSSGVKVVTRTILLHRIVVVRPMRARRARKYSRKPEGVLG